MASEIKVDTVSEKTSGSGVTIDGLLIKDGGISGDVSLIGTTPTFTIGDAGAEDAALVFDGNAQDFYIALDDSADDLLIGLGSTVGTTPAVSIDENLQVKIVATTASTSATTGSFIAAGGAGVAADLHVGDDVTLISDSAVLGFGADKDTTLTHTDGTGLTLNSTNKLCFNDASQFVQGSSATVLSIGATDEIDLTATAVDLNGTLDVSGTSQFNGVATFISGSSGATVSSSANQLVIESSASEQGISILSPADGQGQIFFGDPNSNALAKIIYSHANDKMRFRVNDLYAMEIDSAGIMTRAYTPAFLATKSGAQSNVAINATTTVVFDTEVFDNNADFASNTFTAPVTGRYQFNALINWNGWDTNYVYVWHKFTVSNRTVYANLAGGNQVTADGYLFASSSVLVDMDANDTCKFEVEFPNEGAAQADVQQSSWFSGYLVA